MREVQMELREPKRKRVSPHIKIHQPFPILIESETGIQSHKSLWPLYTGIYNGDCVAVCNPDEMSTLFNMGFFGKGSFSRGYPTFGLSKKGVPVFIYGRQWKQREKWIKKLEQDLHCVKENSNYSNLIPDCEGTTSKDNDHSMNFGENMNIVIESKEAKDLSTEEGDQVKKSSTNNICLDNESEHEFNTNVVVINDSDDEEESLLSNPNVSIESELIRTVEESLNLTLEEAFFLSYALGCLQIFDCNGKFLSLIKLWSIFREAQSDFIENYIAYHYFRAKGWIVKPGYKFGGDLLLYKQGPSFYHASYVVIVESVKERKRSSGSISWNKLQGINRVAETARKEVLLCQIFWPSNLDAEELDSPQVLMRFEVNEVLLRRWISSQERDDKK